MTQRHFTVVALFLLILYPFSAGAIPSLGVIDTDLLATFDADTANSFPFPADGEITVWWGDDSGPALTGVDIWLATTAGPGFTFTVGSTPYALVVEIDDKVDGYPWVEPGVQAYAANLGSFMALSPWVQATATNAPALAEGKQMDFWLLSGTFAGGPGPDGAWWIFAMADTGGSDGVFDEGKDRFSPKTVSTVTPEPATMLLVGFGLIGLAGLGRKKLRRSQE